MIILVYILAYLLGSIPFALIIGKLFYNTDIRKHGSGNMGTTNSVRILGKRAGVIVLIGDVSKGMLASSLPAIFTVNADPLYVGFAAIIGHCFPIYAGFRGGKAVATTIGVTFITDPLLCLVTIISFAGMAFITKYIAIGSLTIAPALSVYSLLIGDINHAIIFLFFIPFMCYLHRSNIRNLKAGTEPKYNDRNLKNEKISLKQ